MANKKTTRGSNKSLYILSSNKKRANKLADGGKFNIGSAVSTGNNALSQINTNSSTGNATQDSINTAINGDSNQDPLSRLYGDLSGNSTKEAKRAIQADTFTSNAKTNEGLMNEWNSINFTEKQDLPRKGEWWKTGLTTMAGAPWLDGSSGKTKVSMDNFKASGKGASAGSSAGPWGALVGGIAGGLANLGSRIGKRKRAQSLNKEIEKSNNAKLNNFNLAATNMEKNSDANIASSFYAFGGNMGYSALDYENNNNININNQISNMADMRLVSMPNSFQKMDKLENINTFPNGGELKKITPIKGKVSGKNLNNPNLSIPYDKAMELFAAKLFGTNADPLTQYKKATEKNLTPTSQKFIYDRAKTSKAKEAAINETINSKHNEFYSTGDKGITQLIPTTTIDNAEAMQAKEFLSDMYGRGYIKYGEGGNLNFNYPDSFSHGGDFSNGLVTVDNGSTHEGNPYGGVPLGADENGNPNLVEQGEAIYNNYVYSNRLFSNKNDLTEVALSTKYDNYSFAKIAEELNKEASERPNDPISNRGLKDSLMKLKVLQDKVKSQKDSKTNIFAYGGNTNSYDSELTQGTPRESWMNYSQTTDDNLEENDKSGFDLSYLRYAPVVGSAIGAASSLFSSPDYSNANLIKDAGRNLSTVGFKPVGEYLTYKPMDKNFYLSKLNANAGATRNAILNNSNGNRSAANAALLASDYNYNNSVGDLARQAEEYDFNQRAQVAGFNRGTNQFNSEGAFKASVANKQNDELRFNAATREATMREGIDDTFSANRSANLTNFFDNIGNVGREDYSRNMLTSNPALYYSIGRNGQITYKNGFDDLSEAEKKEIRSHAKQYSKKNSKKHGGYLTIK